MYIHKYTHIHINIHTHVWCVFIWIDVCMFYACMLQASKHSSLLWVPGSNRWYVWVCAVYGLWCVCVRVRVCWCVYSIHVLICVFRCMSDLDRYVRVCVCVCVLMRVLMSLSDRDHEGDIYKCVREGAHRLCVGYRETVRHQGGG